MFHARIAARAFNTPLLVEPSKALAFVPGVRPWFRRHGLNWQAFLDAGLPAETLRATGDALVEPVIAEAKARETAAVAHGR